MDAGQFTRERGKIQTKQKRIIAHLCTAHERNFHVAGSGTRVLSPLPN